MQGCVEPKARGKHEALGIKGPSQQINQGKHSYKNGGGRGKGSGRTLGGGERRGGKKRDGDG